jgi:uncharacterized membrane protein (UPF0136 family)
MVWIILAALGVPIWLVVGMLVGALLVRRRVRHLPGVFKAKLRLEAGDAGGRKPKWGRAYALWVHDVLLVFGGVALVRTRPLPVAEVLQEPQPVPADEVKKLGDSPQAIRLRLDNGAVVAIAFAAADVQKAFPGPIAARSRACGHGEGQPGRLVATTQEAASTAAPSR